jgi:hypothetical protein
MGGAALVSRAPIPREESVVAGARRSPVERDPLTVDSAAMTPQPHVPEFRQNATTPHAPSPEHRVTGSSGATPGGRRSTRQPAAPTPIPVSETAVSQADGDA